MIVLNNVSCSAQHCSICTTRYSDLIVLNDVCICTVKYSDLIVLNNVSICTIKYSDLVVRV